MHGLRVRNIRARVLQAIHCDVKLENVLIKKSPVDGGRDLLKVADFGLLTPLRYGFCARTTAARNLDPHNAFLIQESSWRGKKKSILRFEGQAHVRKDWAIAPCLRL